MIDNVLKIAIIFAGGVGKRMGLKSTPKQFLCVHGKPIIIYTLEKFSNSPDIDRIVVICLKGFISKLNDLIIKFNIKKIDKIIEGGETGQESIYNGLNFCFNKFPRQSVVLIHDGVRPFIDSVIIKKSILEVVKYRACVCGVRAKETVCLTDSNEIVEALERSKCYLIKAPQTFYLSDIYKAASEAKESHLNFVDSCSLMSYYGYKIHILETDYINIKITTPEDYYMMRALLDWEENDEFKKL